MNWRLLVAFVVMLGMATAMPKDIGVYIDEIFSKDGNRDSSGSQDPSKGLGMTTTTPKDFDALIEEIFGTDGNGNSSSSSSSQNTDDSKNQPTQGHGPTPRGDCECVPYYKCNKTTIKEDYGLIDPIVSHDECHHYLEVCCLPSDRIELPPKNNSSVGMGSHSATGEGGQGSEQPISCGLRNNTDLGTILIQDPKEGARFGEFPWMTAILHEEALENSPDRKHEVFKCGGSLIHPQVVLTAAHCVYKTPTGLKIRAGEWDTQTDLEPLPHQDRNVERIITHPDFLLSKTTLVNDFALLVLDSPVRLAGNVQPVCLPPSGTAVDHGRCVTSGWGKDVFGKEGRYQVIPKKGDVSLVPRPECIERLRTTRLGNSFQLHESFLCAKGENELDACRGDGGSFLICPIKDDPTHYQQLGIVSWSVGCLTPIPAVYADVAYARTWIDSQMKELGFSTSTYIHH